MSYANRFIVRELEQMIESMSTIAASHRIEAKERTSTTADTDYGRGLLVGDAIGMEHAVRRLSRVVDRFKILTDEPDEEAV